VRGLNTAATLWCSAGIGVLCGLGQFKNALVATIIILCANILLREAAQRINQLPISFEEEKHYILKVTFNKEHESAVRQWLLNIVKEAEICLQGLGSVPAQEQDYKEIHAELVGHADYLKARELIISRIGDNDNITAIRWSVNEQ
ncbi:MgtC family protein, partial [Salmonella enterica]|nr:MgtC family protein [Salmonella enterica]